MESLGEKTWPGMICSQDRFDSGFEFGCQSKEFNFLVKSTDNDDASHSSSSALYSLSDISLSNSSTCSEGDARAPENFTFLPPTKSTSHGDNTANLAFQFQSECKIPPEYSMKFLSFEPAVCNTSEQLPDEGFYGDPCSDPAPWQPISSQSQVSVNSAFSFDVESMKEKLAAQKEYLLGSFQKQNTLPQALSTQAKYPKVEKPISLKMKEKLHKFGRATRKFFRNKLLGREQLVQRCEIQLDGFDDRIERLILVVSAKGSGSESVQVYMPSFFETHRLVVPKCMLPSRAGERMTVYVYGVTSEKNGGGLANFAVVIVSGVCSLISGASTMTGRLELQPHRPYHSLMAHNKVVPSAGSSLNYSYNGTDSYSFSTQPRPIAQDYTELCILQTADPFCEYFAISASTCDSPASFSAALQPGSYHAACSFRLGRTPQSGLYTLNCASPSIFFTTYQSKAVMKQMMELEKMHLAAKDEAPALLTSMALLKPSDFSLETFLASLHKGQSTQQVNKSVSATSNSKVLLFCAWDVDSANIASCSDCASVDRGSFRGSIRAGGGGGTGSMVENPRFPTGSKQYVPVPTLSVFNINTRLYFAGSWSYYDKQFVMLVLCPKGSPCHSVCKKMYCKLDPYSNPFLFRKRCYEPEPSVVVYASSSVRVEVIYAESADVQPLVVSSSEQVYFSKVRVGDKSTMN